MRSKITYFFWSTVFSACMLVYTSVNKTANERMKNTLKFVKQMAQKNMPQSVQDRMPPATPEIKHVQEVQDELEEVKTVSSSRNEYKSDDGESYVLIQGKYYKARPDNVYEINGRRVFYVNNRRYAKSEIEGERSTQTEVPTRTTSAPLIDTADVPSSPQEMMQKLQEAQKKMNDRDKYLEELDKQDN